MLLCLLIIAVDIIIVLVNIKIDHNIILIIIAEFINNLPFINSFSI